MTMTIEKSNTEETVNFTRNQTGLLKLKESSRFNSSKTVNLNNLEEKFKNPDCVTVVSTEIEIERKDKFGIIIKKGSKNHKITFEEKIIIVDIESFKDCYNKIEKKEKTIDCNCKCLVF